jgi:hypothetical protein
MLSGSERPLLGSKKAIKSQGPSGSKGDIAGHPTSVKGFRPSPCGMRRKRITSSAAHMKPPLGVAKWKAAEGPSSGMERSCVTNGIPARSPSPLEEEKAGTFPKGNGPGTQSDPEGQGPAGSRTDREAVRKARFAGPIGLHRKGNDPRPEPEGCLGPLG